MQNRRREQLRRALGRHLYAPACPFQRKGVLSTSTLNLFAPLVFGLAQRGLVGAYYRKVCFFLFVKSAIHCHRYEVALRIVCEL